MKVALVIRKYDPAAGGAERWTDHHARMLLNDGHEVHLVATQLYDPPPGAVCHVIDGRTRPGPHVRRVIARRIADFLQAQQYDIIHDMGVGWHCDVFMPHHGAHRAVYDQRSTALIAPERCMRALAYHLLPRYRQFQDIEQRQYVPTPDKLFVAVSDMVRDQMMHHHAVPADRIRVVYNGVDTDHFHPPGSSQAGGRLRAELGFTDETLFLIVAEDFDLKGLATILRAMAQLLASGHRVGLIAVGAGMMKGHKICGIHTGLACNRFPRLARRLGCAHAIRFVGHQSAPRAYYHAADVYVQPSLYDACSLVVLEAMACGLPAITSRHNGVHTLITSGVEGHIVHDPRDAVELAGAMRCYLDPAHRVAAGRRARQRVEAHTSESSFRRILDVYNELTENPARGSGVQGSSTTEPSLHV